MTEKKEPEDDCKERMSENDIKKENGNTPENDREKKEPEDDCKERMPENDIKKEPDGNREKRV